MNFTTPTNVLIRLLAGAILLMTISVPISKSDARTSEITAQRADILQMAFTAGDTIFQEDFSDLNFAQNAVNDVTISGNPSLSGSLTENISPSKLWTLCKRQFDTARNFPFQHPMCAVGSADWHSKDQLSVITDANNTKALRITAISNATYQNLGGFGYKSAHINTFHSFQFMYGHVEARIRMPAQAKGAFPAFWMLDAYTHWRQEIDIMEMVSYNGGSYRNSGTVHLWQKDPAQPTKGSHNLSFESTVGNMADGQYHIYAVDWTPDGITWLVDGVVKKQVTAAELRERIHAPMYLMLGLQVNERASTGGCETGSSVWMGGSDTPLCNTAYTMDTDYVKVVANEYTQYGSQLPKTLLKHAFSYWNIASFRLNTKPEISWDTGWVNVEPATTECSTGLDIDAYASNCGSDTTGARRYTLKIDLNNTSSDAYVQKTYTETIKDHRVSFLLDTQNITIPISTFHYIFAGYDTDGTTRVARIRLSQVGNQYGICAEAHLASGYLCKNVAPGLHAIDFDWWAAAPNMSNGGIKLWVNGVAVAPDPGVNVSNFANSAQSIQSVRLGALNVGAGDAGVYYLDTFRSWKLASITSPPSTSTPIPTATFTPTPVATNCTTGNILQNYSFELNPTANNWGNGWGTAPIWSNDAQSGAKSKLPNSPIPTSPRHRQAARHADGLTSDEIGIVAG